MTQQELSPPLTDQEREDVARELADAREQLRIRQMSPPLDAVGGLDRWRDDLETRRREIQRLAELLA